MVVEELQRPSISTVGKFEPLKLSFVYSPDEVVVNMIEVGQVKYDHVISVCNISQMTDLERFQDWELPPDH